jgi:hypothetical protein
MLSEAGALAWWCSWARSWVVSGPKGGGPSNGWNGLSGSPDSVSGPHANGYWCWCSGRVSTQQEVAKQFESGLTGVGCGCELG